MEKRSPNFSIGLVLYPFLTILFFSLGNSTVIDFVTNPEVNHNIYDWLPILGPITFFSGYFVELLSYKTLHQTKRYSLGSIVLFILLLVAIVLGQTVFRDSPVNLLMLAGINYSLAGVFFASVMDRLGTVVKP